MSSAPVCHISSDEIIDQPQPARFQSIPVATNLQSAIAAINAMRLVMLQLTGQVSPNNLARFLGLLGAVGAGLSQNQKNQPNPNSQSRAVQNGRFLEDKSQRVTNDVEVPIYDDTNTKVGTATVARINRVVWVDQVTNQTIVWTR